MDMLTAMERLLKECSYKSWEQMLECITTPNWDQCSRVHDWRNYVPEALQSVWGDLLIETQIVAYCVAEKQALAEDWE